MNQATKRQVVPTEKRQSFRLDKVFPVWVSSSEHGDLQGVARNISAGGIFIETQEPIPLGTQVKVIFAVPESSAQITACGEVKNHYFLNYGDGDAGARSVAGMGVRFMSFEADGADALARSLRGLRVLH
jgi:uncharacterized protein (TIGR02266 family)